MAVTISIVIPVYNIAPYLDKCVASVVAQTYRQLDIILIDDGSTDGSSRICDVWAGRDSRIRVVHQENQGLSAARNTGIKLANGEYIGLVDGDDYIDSRMYEILLSSILEKENIGVSSCLCLVEENGKTGILNVSWEDKGVVLLPGSDYARSKIMEETPHMAWNKLYRAEILKTVPFRAGRNNEDTLHAFDMGRELKRRGMNEIIVPDHLYFYRIRFGGICRNSERVFQIEILNNLHQLIGECTEDELELAESIRRKYLETLRNSLGVLKKHRDAVIGELNVHVLYDALVIAMGDIGSLEARYSYTNKYTRWVYRVVKSEKIKKMLQGGFLKGLYRKK